jgi:hypothetical protein
LPRTPHAYQGGAGVRTVETATIDLETSDLETSDFELQVSKRLVL